MSVFDSKGNMRTTKGNAGLVFIAGIVCIVTVVGAPLGIILFIVAVIMWVSAKE